MWVGQEELNKSYILGRTVCNFLLVLVVVLNSECCWCITASILLCNLPTFNTIEVLVKVSCYEIRRSKLHCTIKVLVGKLRIVKSHVCLNITYCNVECTTIRVCQSTIIVDCIYTETDDITLYITHVLDSDSTLIALEQCCRNNCCTILLVTNTLVSVRVPSIDLRWSRLNSESSIESYIEALDALVLTKVDRDWFTLFYSQNVLCLTIIKAVVTFSGILLATLQDNRCRRLVVVNPIQLLCVCFRMIILIPCNIVCISAPVTVVDNTNKLLVYIEVISWLSYLCSQVNTILRCYTTCALILSLASCIVCVLNCNRIEY